jgi:hypothetical protein
VTKTVAKSVNPHYNAMHHFTNISREILLKTTIHAAILGELYTKDIIMGRPQKMLM